MRQAIARRKQMFLGSRLSKVTLKKENATRVAATARCKSKAPRERAKLSLDRRSELENKILRLAVISRFFFFTITSARKKRFFSQKLTRRRKKFLCTTQEFHVGRVGESARKKASEKLTLAKGKPPSPFVFVGSLTISLSL